ncbi:MAG: sulfite exporter TauE/SafE family protein [Ruminococcaceae bacterium]|nr:sulfite exporter TauE/SafE family protein [Oscillospiraceae bacterium]
MEFLIKLLAGTVTGILTGFGIGGGTLLILYLTMFRNTPQLEAQGINLIYFLPTASGALVSHIKSGNIKFRPVLCAAIPGTVAAIVAAFFASRIDMTILRRIFGGFLVLVGISELFAKKRSRG